MSYIIKEEAEAFFRNLRKRMNPKDYKTAREFDFVDSVLLNAEQFIHLMPKQDVIPAPKWISVNERLPERCGYYLVFTNNFGANSILVSKYADYGTFKSWCVKTTVTHWMPLPEPPKEGGHGDGN